MSRSSRKKEKLARKQIDRQMTRRRTRDRDERNGDDNKTDGDDIQFKGRNSRKEEYRM